MLQPAHAMRLLTTNMVNTVASDAHAHLHTHNNTSSCSTTLTQTVRQDISTKQQQPGQHCISAAASAGVNITTCDTTIPTTCDTPSQYPCFHHFTLQVAHSLNNTAAPDNTLLMLLPHFLLLLPLLLHQFLPQGSSPLPSTTTSASTDSTLGC